MKVSAIITCHDLGEFIDECVASVVSQDVPELEIIVVDDSSTDPRTLEVLNRLPVKYRNLRVIRTEHRNVSLARNSGFVRSSGQFILFVDGDDMLGEKFLSTTVCALEARPNCGVVYTDLKLIGLETGTWVTGPALFPQEIYFDNYLQYCSLIRRSVIETYGGFNHNLFSRADWDFWIKLHMNGVRFLKAPGVYALYRKRGNSMLARSQSKEPYLYNQIILNHKELYSRLFLCPISDREERYVRDLLQAVAENPHNGAMAKLRATRLYRQFTCYNIAVRAYRKGWRTYVTCARRLGGA